MSGSFQCLDQYRVHIRPLPALCSESRIVVGKHRQLNLSIVFIFGSIRKMLFHIRTNDIVDDLMLSGDQNLDMAQFGRTWLAFRRMSQSEIDERNRPVNLLSKRRALKHCVEVLVQLREHKPRAFYHDPQLCNILQQMEGEVADTDELLDKLLWA